MVDVLLELDPERYGPCVCHHKGRKFLYAKAVKAVCGAMRSALLFYQQLFSGQLKERMGHEQDGEWFAIDNCMACRRLQNIA